MSDVKPIPDGYHSLSSHLVCDGAAEAIEYYKKAFNAELMGRMDGPDGKVMYACLKIGDSLIMLNDEFPDYQAFGPKHLGGSPVVIHLYTENADAVYQQAVDAGATPTMPMMDAFWGDRYGKLTDPFGHHWAIATHVEDVSGEEMARRAEEMFSGAGECS